MSAKRRKVGWLAAIGAGATLFGGSCLVDAYNYGLLDPFYSVTSVVDSFYIDSFGYDGSCCDYYVDDYYGYDDGYSFDYYDDWWD
jgi:hypothetical protein